jgi:ParB/RepB/Spo0J family partition protein
MKVLDLPISQINVPGDRFKAPAEKDIANIQDSISRLGLLNPITVEEADSEGLYTLVAGQTRLIAYQRLGHATIPANLRGDINNDPLRHREIELEENAVRTDVSPQEKARAIAEIHRLKQSQNQAWGQAQTAALIGSNRRADVADALRIDTMLSAFPELANQKFKSINQLANVVDSKARLMLRKLKVDDAQAEARATGNNLSAAEHIWLGDSVELIKEVPDEQFHLILTDPPFGVDYNNKIAGTAGELTAYEDTEENYRRILSMAGDLYRTLRPDGWLVWFFGSSWYGDRLPQRPVDTAQLRRVAAGMVDGSIHPLVGKRMLEDLADWHDEVRRGVVSTFREVGFVVDEIPVVWDRSEGKTFTRTPNRTFARSFDLAIMCRKGEPNIVRKGLPNVIHIPPVENSDRETLVERPVALYEEFITRLTVPGEFVADFFVGGGGCPAACAKTRRNYFGIELNPERRAYAISKIQGNTPPGTSPVTPEWITRDAPDSSGNRAGEEAVAGSDLAG